MCRTQSAVILALALLDTQVASNGVVRFMDFGQCERAAPDAVRLRFYRVRLNRD